MAFGDLRELEGEREEEGEKLDDEMKVVVAGGFGGPTKEVSLSRPPSVEVELDTTLDEIMTVVGGGVDSGGSVGEGRGC